MNTESLTHESVEFLLQEISGGNREAEQLLVSKYWRGLYFILTSRLQDPDLASDLTQDAFLIVITKAREGKIENTAAFSSFVRQVGINLMIAHLRKEKRRSTDDYSDVDTIIPDDSPDIYRQLYSSEMLALVQRLVDELTVDRDRQILRQYFVYEKNKSSICENLELSSDHFDRVLFRAKQRLKELLQAKLEPVDKNNLRPNRLKTSVLVLLLLLQLPTPPNGIAKYEMSVRVLSAIQHYR